jgi:hypothetical protein
MWKSVTVVTVCLVAAQLRAEPELKGSPPELAAYLAGVPQLVSITGEAELKVPADHALISLKVVTESRSLQEASRANQEIRAKILRSLADNGIPANRVKPSNFSSTPKYGVFREKAKSYRVENIVKVTVQDEKEFQAVANLVDTIGEVHYESIEFEHSDKEGLKTKALAQAIDKASEKKRLYEEKLGVKLSPRQFTEGGVLPIPQPVRRRYYDAKATERISYGAPSSSSLAAVGESETAEEEMPTAFSELVFAARVTVVFAVESK